jgi:radical SAM superfamily enzyme YgiQ (UPF0313 family)
MNNYDILFIHPSALLSSPQFITMPMGMISLMNELNEYDVKAVNVGLEMSLNRNFDLRKFLKRTDFDMVGIDLHWHEHAYSSLETAKMCKDSNPDCLVILGGLTASYFAEEILRFSDCIDLVISGEAEGTMPLLLKKEDFSRIPNLVYRDGTVIRRTPTRPLSSIDTLDYTTIVNLQHWEEYLKCSIHSHLMTRFWYNFWLCTGRGCTYDCSYCGGGKSAQKRISGRENLSFRSVDRVIQDLIYLQDLGVHTVNFSQDVVLAGENYWKELFKSMKKEEIYMGLYLEVFQLPNKHFVEELSRTCNNQFSTVVITVLSGSETVRRKNGKHFSNQDYYECVRLLNEYEINHVPYFATGLPFETLETFNQTLSMTEKILLEFNPSLIFCTPLRLDPGSPMYEYPEHYKIVKHCQNFTDYYERCRRRAENLPYDLMGYHTKFLSEDQIMSMQNEWETLLRSNSEIVSGAMHSLHFL